MRKKILFFVCFTFLAYSQKKHTPVTTEITRWQIGNDNDIIWHIANERNLPHEDHLEMSGKKVSVIVTYKVDAQKKLKVNKRVIFPTMLLKYDNRSYLECNDSIVPEIRTDGKKMIIPLVDNIRFNGIIEFNYAKSELGIKRSIFPSPDKAAIIDRWEITNTTLITKNIEVEGFLQTNSYKGEETQFIVETKIEKQNISLRKGEQFIINIEHSGRISSEKELVLDSQIEMQSRIALINAINKNLQLKTPDSVLNREFQFSKIRTAESIFDTEMGLVHSPGGGRYYGGIWANDQVEYAGPFFPYLGYDIANQASVNAYKIFMKAMSPDFKAIPSSYEMQGHVTYTEAGDRGDAAMYGWGASLYALTRGDKTIAKELWPAIKWCLEYNERKMTSDGVVASTSDEMEGRVETGSANLSTSSLAYGAFSNAVLLAKALNEPQCVIDHYSTVAANLRIAIDKYFGADIDGYHTYRYYDGHKTLRHWICLPMVMGINERQEGTTKALFERLWTVDGLLVEKGLNTFWDRATLYALRGIFKGGETGLALEKLKDFSTQRLLREHVPYPIEAYPEGNQAHLSAESALYCRIYIEGLFGIQPLGFSQFTCTPRLPDGWDEMSLANICAFNSRFSVVVKSENQNNIKLSVLKEGKEIYSKIDKKGSKFSIDL